MKSKLARFIEREQMKQADFIEEITFRQLKKLEKNINIIDAFSLRE